MITVDDLKNMFSVKEDLELAKILGRSPQSVSGWKRTGVPAAIERKASEIMREKGICPGLVSEPETAYTPDMITAIKLLEGSPWWLKTLTEIADLPPAQQNEKWQEIQKMLKGGKEG